MAIQESKPTNDPKTEKPAVMERFSDRFTVKLYGVNVFSTRYESIAYALASDLNTAIKRHEGRKQ